MLTERRQEEIVRLVYERESITVAELKEILNTSESTIRRDIITLDKEGRLTKVFGGAIALHPAQIVNKELSMVQKQELQTTEKQAIARYAASLIEPDDCVYLDAGTTTGWMIEYIRQEKATYITNALSHAKRLADKGFNVILIGGEPKSSTDAIVGGEAVLFQVVLAGGTPRSLPCLIQSGQQHGSEYGDDRDYNKQFYKRKKMTGENPQWFQLPRCEQVSHDCPAFHFMFVG